MADIKKLIKTHLSKDGQVLNLKAKYIREVGAKELAQCEELSTLRALDLSQNDIGDVGVLSKLTSQKKPILEKLIGRTNDIAVLPSGKKAAGLTFYYVTKSIIEDDGNVKEFVIEQLSLDTFKILYVSANNLSENKIKTIKAEMENYLEKGLTIQFERLNQMQRSKSGKLKQFSSLIQNKT